MIKRGFALTLMTVAIALIQVSTSHATAPVIADPGDVIIGDLEGIHGPATGSNIFVFPDAIDLNGIVTDDTTPDNQIKWSFTTDAGHFTSIRINGIGPVAATLLGLDDDDPTSPRAANRIDLNNLDTGQPGDLADSDPFTATFRNVVLSPGVSDEDPYFGPAGFITTQTAVVTLFASDCSTFSARNITVYAAQGSSDSISGGGPQLLATVDFTATTDGWIGGAIGGLGGTVSSGASGLCMTVPAAGNNLVGWFSPEGYVELVANTIYRVRANLTMSAPASPPADTIPLLLFQYDNFFTAGNGNNIGGFSWILDVDGDAQGIGRGNGRNQYDFWLAPNAVATAQWNAGAFTVAADAVNDIRLQFVVNDANVNLLTQNDAGTICVQSIEIASIGHDNLQGTTVYNPPLDTSTHFVLNDFGAGSSSSINNATDSASIQLGTTGDVRVTLGPDDQLADGVPGAQFGKLELYPIVWEANTLYRTRVRIRAATSETNPIDAIFMAMDVTNNELGMNSYTTSNGGSVMIGAASPKLTAATYEGYFFSQNATDSVVVDANRLRPIPFFFNTTNLFGNGTGGDAIVVESIEVDKITSGTN